MQREIYISGEINEPIKVLKGQKILQDGSILEEQGITDASTVNILMELEQCISINVKCGPKIYRKEITNSVTVREFKIDLVKSNRVAFPLNQFELAKMMRTDDNERGDDIIIMVELDDEDVPLHHFGIQSDTNMTVITSFIMINILNVNGEYLYRRFPKHMKVQELKSVILRSKHLYTTFDYYDFVMFVKRENETFVELDLDAEYSVNEVLAEDDTLYLTADTFFKYHYPLYFNGSEMGKIGVTDQESVLNLKLWTQAQTGIPVSNIRVLRSPPPKRSQVAIKPEMNQQTAGNPSIGFVPVDYEMGSIGGINSMKDNVKLSGQNKYYIEIF